MLKLVASDRNLEVRPEHARFHHFASPGAFSGGAAIFAREVLEEVEKMGFLLRKVLLAVAPVLWRKFRGRKK